MAVLPVLVCCGSPATRLERLGGGLFPPEEPGGAVLVLQGEDILFERYYGVASLGGAPVTADTRFNLASVSKQFTAVAVLQLVAAGQVDLDASVQTYFPEYTHPLWKEVRIRHLLSHSSGIPDARGYLTREQKIYGDEDLALDYLARVDSLHFPPGTAYEYLNPGYVLLGRLVERISGEPFPAYMQEHVFDPAGMGGAAYFEPGLTDAAHAYEYPREASGSEESGSDRPAGKHAWYEYDYGEETFFATRPDGGLYATAKDMVQWEKALRKCLSGAPDAILPAGLLEEAFRPQILVSGSPWSDYQNRPGTCYGFGWFLEPEKGCIYHTGDNGGFKILAARYPASDTFLLILAARADWDRYAVKTRVEKVLGFSEGGR